MKTFQDFQNAGDKLSFISSAVDEFKGSFVYNNALDAQAYYRGCNTTIANRLQWFYNSMGIKEVDKFKANNRIANNMFNKIVKQEVSYLLSNGLQTEEEIKTGLGKLFDTQLQKAGLFALVDYAGWGYCYIDVNGNFALDIWRGTEVVPLEDEKTGQVRAVIRFWQIDPQKPTWIELYEEDGKTELKKEKNNIVVTSAKQGYKVTKTVDILGERITNSENFSKLPIFPLYANDIRQSEFNFSLKSKLDLYDIINSDFGNNLEDNQDIYWVLKNYEGQDMGEFLADFKYYKAVKTNDPDSEATPHTIEVPYQARQTALDMLRTQIYSDSMALDNSILSGGSLTNVAIKANMMDLDLKVDAFETNCIKFCTDIINLYLEITNKQIDFTVNFVRNQLINDEELITEIIDSVNAGLMSRETAMLRHPLIDDIKLEKNLINEEDAQKFERQPTVEEEE